MGRLLRFTIVGEIDDGELYQGSTIIAGLNTMGLEDAIGILQDSDIEGKAMLTIEVIGTVKTHPDHAWPDDPETSDHLIHTRDAMIKRA